MNNKEWFKRRDLVAEYLRARDHILLNLVGGCAEYFIADNIMFILFGENKPRYTKKGASK